MDDKNKYMDGIKKAQEAVREIENLEPGTKALAENVIELTKSLVLMKQIVENNRAEIKWLKEKVEKNEEIFKDFLKDSLPS